MFLPKFDTEIYSRITDLAAFQDERTHTHIHTLERRLLFFPLSAWLSHSRTLFLLYNSSLFYDQSSERHLHVASFVRFPLQRCCERALALSLALLCSVSLALSIAYFSFSFRALSLALAFSAYEHFHSAVAVRTGCTSSARLACSLLFSLSLSLHLSVPLPFLLLLRCYVAGARARFPLARAHSKERTRSVVSCFSGSTPVPSPPRCLCLSRSRSFSLFSVFFFSLPKILFFSSVCRCAATARTSLAHSFFFTLPSTLLFSLFFWWKILVGFIVGFAAGERVRADAIGKFSFLRSF